MKSKNLERECEHIFKKDDLVFCKLKTNQYYDKRDACYDSQEYETCLVYTIDKYRGIMK